MADDKHLQAKVTINSDVDGLKRITLSSTDTEKAIKQLNQAVKNAGTEARESSQDIDKLAKNLNDLESELKQNAAAAKTAEEILKDLNKGASRGATDIEKLAYELQKSAQHWKTLNSAHITARSEYKILQATIGTTTEQFEQQSQKIKDVQKQELAAIESTRELVEEYRQKAGVLGMTNTHYDQLSRRLQEAEGWITGITPKLKMQEKGFKDVAGAIDHVGDEVRGLGSIFSDAMGRINTDIDEVLIGAAVAGFNFVVDAAQNAGRAVVEFVNEANTEFQDFDREIRQVYTLIPGQSEAMKQAVGGDLREMGKEIGRISDEYLPAMYQALSLGIPKDNSLDALKTASQAARAANAELTPTLVTGQSIVNAYGGELYDLNRVYDLLFFAVKNGAVTIDELNAGMSEITSVAGEANVPLEDIVSAIIVMTKQGDSFNEVSGLMSNMLTQLSIS
ncbi:MAG: phage tail tape measure protein, partial [Chloroflexi bacterium]|nr:phage tail tape measure protein [Chloroflexota bacterium]